MVLSFFLPPSIYTYPPFPFNHRQSWSLYTVKSFFSSFYRIGMEFRFFTFLLSLFFANFSFFTFGFLWCQFNYIQQENARLSNLSYGRTLSRTIMMMMNDGMAKKKQWSFCSPFHLFNFVDLFCSKEKTMLICFNIFFIVNESNHGLFVVQLWLYIINFIYPMLVSLPTEVDPFMCNLDPPTCMHCHYLSN